MILVGVEGFTYTKVQNVLFSNVIIVLSAKCNTVMPKTIIDQDRS